MEASKLSNIEFKVMIRRMVNSLKNMEIIKKNSQK